MCVDSTAEIGFMQLQWLADILMFSVAHILHGQIICDNTEGLHEGHRRADTLHACTLQQKHKSGLLLCFPMSIDTSYIENYIHWATSPECSYMRHLFQKDSFLRLVQSVQVPSADTLVTAKEGDVCGGWGPWCQSQFGASSCASNKQVVPCELGTTCLLISGGECFPRQNSIVISHASIEEAERNCCSGTSNMYI